MLEARTGRTGSGRWREYVTAYALAEARGSDVAMGRIELRIAAFPLALSELREEAGRVHRRYVAEIAEWMTQGAQDESRLSIRRAVRAIPRKNRVRAMRLSLSYAVTDWLQANAGSQCDGGTANDILSGEVEPPRALRPAVRFYRRLSGECPGCGNQDARHSGAVCDECGC